MSFSILSRLGLRADTRAVVSRLCPAALVLSIAAAVSLTAPVPSRAAIFTFQTALEPEVSGATGSGFAGVTLDTAAHTLTINMYFDGLSGPTTVAHIHCCTAFPGFGTVGVAVTPGTLPGFPVGVTSGSYFTVLDTSQSATFTASFVTNFGGGTIAGAESALLAGLLAGTAYFNVHSTTFPAGEIRGFLGETPIPGALPLFASALGVLGLVAWRRKRKTTGASTA